MFRVFCGAAVLVTAFSASLEADPAAIISGATGGDSTAAQEAVLVAGSNVPAKEAAEEASLAADSAAFVPPEVNAASLAADSAASIPPEVNAEAEAPIALIGGAGGEMKEASLAADSAAFVPPDVNEASLAADSAAFVPPDVNAEAEAPIALIGGAGGEMKEASLAADSAAFVPPDVNAEEASLAADSAAFVPPEVNAEAEAAIALIGGAGGEMKAAAAAAGADVAAEAHLPRVAVGDPARPLEGRAVARALEDALSRQELVRPPAEPTGSRLQHSRAMNAHAVAEGVKLLLARAHENAEQLRKSYLEVEFAAHPNYISKSRQAAFWLELFRR